jgi:hypothetical protein
MKWEISNNKNKSKLAVIVALVAFSTVFMLTGALLTSVYGIKPGDPDFSVYPSNDPSIKITPYVNFLMNGCLTKTFVQGDAIVILDTKGLEELGMFYYDPNTCMDMALGMTESGYIIDKVEPYKITTPGPFGIEKDQMKITLVKKP